MLNVKRYWSLLVTSFVMLFSVNSFAFSVDDLQQQLAKSTLVRGDFKQVRTMQMFAQPLSTSGTFFCWIMKRGYCGNKQRLFRLR